MERRTLSILIVSAALALPGTIIAQTGGRLDKTDANYLKVTAQGLMSQVKLGQLAKSKASDPRVKQFAQRMIDDHSKDLKNLQHLAKQKGVRLPTAPNAKQTQMTRQLAGLSGRNFDRAYMGDEIKDHQHDVAMNSQEIQRAKDPDIKQFASIATPEMRAHLRLAQEISGKL